MKIKAALLGLLFAGIIVSGAADASLIGSEVTASSTYRAKFTPAIAVVGNGVEFVGLGGALSFDFAENTLTISLLGRYNVGWGSWGNFYFSGFSDPITSMSLLSNRGFTGTLAEGDFGFSPDSIRLGMSSGFAGVGSSIVLGIESNPASVHEPGSLALFALAISGLAIFGRKM